MDMCPLKRACWAGCLLMQGAERAVRVPLELERFAELPMKVSALFLSSKLACLSRKPKTADCVLAFLGEKLAVCELSCP